MGSPPATPQAPDASGRFRWHVNVDRHLNPLLPASVLPRLPHPIAHYLGYRSHPSAGGFVGNLIVVFWAAIGIFSSLAIIGAVSQQVPEFQRRGVPVVVGSFGAAAVLDFYAIESPLAQPRNAVLGQLFSAIIGVGLTKLFQLSPHFDSVRWLGASLACALSTVVMGLTGTAHPPAGATALMAVLDDDVTKLGWFLIPPIMLGSTLMLSVALLVNNVQRRFPYYWWSPEEMGMRWRKEHIVHGKKTEADHSPGTEDSASISRDMEAEAGGDAEPDEEQPTVEFVIGEDTLVVAKHHVRIPKSMYLTFEEKLLLETLSQRL